MTDPQTDRPDIPPSDLIARLERNAITLEYTGRLHRRFADDYRAAVTALREKDEEIARLRQERLDLAIESEDRRRASNEMAQQIARQGERIAALEGALQTIRRRAIYGPSIALSDLLDLTLIGGAVSPSPQTDQGARSYEPSGPTSIDEEISVGV